jgi:hypothetical protein
MGSFPARRAERPSLWMTSANDKAGETLDRRPGAKEPPLEEDEMNRSHSGRGSTGPR